MLLYKLDYYYLCKVNGEIMFSFDVFDVSDCLFLCHL